MRREVIKTAKSVEEAIALACAELGVDQENAEIEVLAVPQAKKFLFFGGSDAKVKVSIDDGVAEAPVKEAPVKKEKKAAEKANVKKAAPAKAEPKAKEKKVDNNKVTLAVDYVKDMLEKMGLKEVVVDHKVEDGVLVLNVNGPGVGILIGRRGETLDAIQYLTGLVANKGGGDYLKVTVDSGNYREKRKATLEALAVKIANNAVKSGRSTTLEAMNPYERRIIHSAVQTVEGATSKSVGEDPYRKVVISSTNPVKKQSRGGGRRNGNGGKNGGRRGNYRDRREKAPAYVPDPNAEIKVEKSVFETADAPLYSKIDI